MERKYPFIALLFSVLLLIASSGNPPNARTGAPGDFGTCQSCHIGSNPNITGEVNITGVPNTVLAGETYNISVTSSTPGFVALKAGFQMVVLDDETNNVGTLSNPDDFSTITSANSRFYHEHNPSRNLSNGTYTWTVDWTAPDGGTVATDSIIFYASSLLANLNNSTSGDKTVLTNTSVAYDNGLTMEVLIEDFESELCFGETTSATAVASMGTEPYTYLWNDGTTDDFNDNMSGGTYEVTATDANGNTATNAITIVEREEIVILDRTVIDSGCEGEATGSVNYEIENLTLPFSVQIINSNGNTIFTGTNLFFINNLPPDLNYTIVFIDDFGCSISDNFSINAAPLIVVESVNVMDVLCHGDSTGNIFLDVSGTQPFSFEWNDGSTDQNLTNVPAGSYSVTITDGNDCEISQNYTITEPTQALFATIDYLQLNLCAGDEIAILAVFPLHGTPPYQYLWSNSDTTDTIENLPSGNYSVTVTDANNCTVTDNWEIDTLSPIIIDLVITQESEPDAGDGSITAIVDGGNPDYNYQWSNGSNDQTIINLNPGVYTLTVTDQNDCIVTANGTIEGQTCDLNSNLSLQNNTCYGQADGSAILAVQGQSGDLTIAWSTGATGDTINSLPAGSFSVSFTDEAACTDSISFEITEPDSLLVQIDTIIPITCNMPLGSITVSTSGGTGDYSYQWMDGSTENFYQTDMYEIVHVTVTDSNACASELSYEFVESPELLVSLDIDQESTPGAMDGTITANPSGGSEPYMFLWEDGTTDASIENLGAGTYLVTVTDANSCEFVISGTISNVPCNLSIATESQELPDCVTLLGSIEVSASGGTQPYAFQWSSGEDSSYVQTTTEGIFAVTVSDVNGCTAELSYDQISIDTLAPIAYFEQQCLSNLESSVAVDQAFILSAIDSIFDNCSEDFSYIIPPTLTLDCDDIGLHTVNFSVIDESSNQADFEMIIEVKDTIPPLFSNCVEDHAITLCDSLTLQNIDYQFIINNECEPIEFVYEGTTDGSIFVADSAGVFPISVTAIDASGNQSICAFVVTVVESDLQVEHTTQDVSCWGGNDGQVLLIVSGGTPPYQIPDMLENLPAGFYEISVLDQECKKDVSFEINQPEEIKVVVNSSSDATQGNMDGQLDIEVTGGVPGYEYEWIKDGIIVSTNQDLTDVPAGTYELTIVDLNGCIFVFVFTIDELVNTDKIEYNQLNLYPNPVTVYLNIESSLSIESFTVQDVMGYTKNIQFSRNNGKYQLDFSALIPGTYILGSMTKEHKYYNKIIKH